LVTDKLGCMRYDSVDFVSHPLPKVYLGNDTLLCDNQKPYELNAGDYPSYEWSTSSGSLYTGNPYYIYPVNGTIDSLTVKVTDLNGCSNSDTIVIFPCDIASLFKDMPNTITPNGDDMNDKWVIPYMEEFPNAVLEIFDRWGRLVYHTNQVHAEPWDGTSKGRDMPMDVYYYVLDLKYSNVGQITGSLNLIR
jgi:gliding motility-associated-like protein